MVTGRERSILPAAGLLLAGLGSIVVAGWLDPRADDDAARLVATMLRAIIVTFGAYAALLGALSLLAELFGWSRALRWSARLGAARLGLAAGVAVASLGSAAISTPNPVGAGELAETPADTDNPPIASLRPIETPVATLTPLPTVDEATPTPAEQATWTVEQGDHLWSIAEARVGETDDLEIHDYWVRLVELNADRLVVPDDPDLILPGQELLLPDR